MYTLVTAVHLIVSILMIVVVLFQAEEGEGLSGAFGTSASSSGGRGAMFGKKGAAGAVARFTAGLVMIFMVTSFSLSLMASKDMVDRTEYAPMVPVQAPAQ